MFIQFGMVAAPSWKPQDKLDGEGDVILGRPEYVIKDLIAGIFFLIYFFIFGLIMKAIISGMIIEAFGAKRRNAQAQTSEKLNICPICNLSRKELGK